MATVGGNLLIMKNKSILDFFSVSSSHYLKYKCQSFLFAQMKASMAGVVSLMEQSTRPVKRLDLISAPRYQPESTCLTLLLIAFKLK